MAKRSKKNTYEVDFTGVEGRTSCPQGEGLFEVTGVEFVDNDGDGAFAWKFDILEFEPDDPKAKAPKTFSDRTGLSTNQLWNLRNRLEALGAEVPDGPLQVDFDELVGLKLLGTIKHTVSGDKTYQNLTDYMPADGEAGASESTDEEEEEEVKVTKKKKSRDADEEEEDEKPVKKKRATRDEEEEEEEEAPKKKSKRAEPEEEEEEDEKPAKKKKKQVDEDDEEEEAPKKKSKVKKYSTDDIRDHDEDGLQELIDKHSLDVDLEDHSNLRKKAMAVADALDDAGLLED